MVGSGGGSGPREVVVEGGAGRSCYRMQQFRAEKAINTVRRSLGSADVEDQLPYNNARCLNDTAAVGSDNRSAATNGGPSREGWARARCDYRLLAEGSAGLKPPADGCLQMLTLLLTTDQRSQSDREIEDECRERD